jgi:lipopolysaccharide transport system permease protein
MELSKRLSESQHPVRETVIESAAGWGFDRLRELWGARHLCLLLGWRDIQLRYKQTLLGVLWVVLQPLAQMLVFTLVLGRFSSPDQEIPYPIYVFAGLLPWNFFAGAVGNAAGSVVGSEQLITKIYFPRLAIPLAAVLAAGVDFAVSLVAFIPLMWWYGPAPSWGLFLLPVLMLLTTGLAQGLGAFLAGVNVLYRDVRYLVPFFLQLGMFATPAIYLPTVVGAEVQTTSGLSWGPTLLRLNPMAGLVDAFRAALLGRGMPWWDLGYATAASLGVLAAGVYLFGRVEDSFADSI